MTNQYELTLLTTEQVTKIYNERMVEDFPPDELKPLDFLLKLMAEGKYICYGLMEEEDIISYCFLNRLEGSRDYLIDYLATASSRRNERFGATVINLLAGKLSDAGSIIAEVENPECATDTETRALQARRFGFYMRNGFRDTNVRVTCFGVPFILIEMGEGLLHPEDEIKELYKCHYKSMLPKALYEANVVV